MNRSGAIPSRTSGLLRVGGVYGFVLVLLATGRLLSDDFWAPTSLFQLVKDVSILGIVAVGVSFITMSGNYVDLSIPAIMATSGIAAVCALPAGLPVAVTAALAVGVAIGLLNGWMVGGLKLNPILWTLAAQSIIDGAVRWAYGGKWVYARADTPAGAAFAGLYRGEVAGGIPLAVLIFAAAAAAGHVLMHRTGYGRRLKMTGAAPEAARLAGIGVRRVVLAAFVLSGVASAVAGLVKTSFTMYGDVEIGLTYDFQAVTAVVLGGVTLAGGRGSVAGVIGGVLVIGLLGRILPLVPGIGQDEQYIIRGVIFMTVVGLNMYALRRTGRSDA